MRIIKTAILTFLFLSLGAKGFCIDVTGPTVDFGTANYLHEASGFNQITVPYEGNTTTAGTGYIIEQTGGSSGSVVLTNFTFLEQMFTTIYLEIKTNSYTISTPNCGQITISNIHTTGGDTSANKYIAFASSISFPIGATMTLNSFNGTSPCYIQGTIANAITYRKASTSATNVPLTVKVYVVPNMAIAHDNLASLNFGTICKATTQQVLTIAPDGGVSGTYVCPTQNTSADSFTVTGNNNQSFSVTLPATVNISNGSNNLTVSNLTPSCSSNCQLTANTYNLKVGGTLTVPANTAIGHYQGNYTVTIDY